MLFFLNWWILSLPLPVEAVAGFYTASMAAGYVCLLMAGTWMSFPEETYKGVTYTMGTADICSNDDGGKTAALSCHMS